MIFRPITLINQPTLFVHRGDHDRQRSFDFITKSRTHPLNQLPEKLFPHS